MNESAELVARWASFDESAFAAASRVQRALDAWCDGRGEAPAPAEIQAARRLRFVANHRLRWILFQTRRAQDRLRLL